MNRNILITGGGTGGHITPGIALYEEFRARGVRAHYLAGNRDKRFSTLNDVALHDLHFYGAPPLTKNIFKLPFFVLRFVAAILKAKRIMKRNNINGVIGMGGYVSGPALIAAKMKKITIYLCEQNSVPGKVTVSFEKSARRIYSTFEVTKQYMKFPDKFFHAGNPIRSHVLSDATKQDAKKAFHLEQSKKVILAIGGSQGAVKINELMLGLKQQFPDEFKDTGVIWSTGEYSYDKYREQIQNDQKGGAVYLSPFIDRVGLAYRACDIAIARSGAGVMMELAAMGVPSIQIPYPFAAKNHQDKNADAFRDCGAALKILDSEATPAKVGPALFGLLNNQRALAKMGEQALAVAKRDSAALIVNDIIKDEI